MKSITTTGTLQALIRTAEWAVNDVHMAHSEAISLGEQSQQALTHARQQREDSHEHLRQLLNGEVLNAGDLQLFHLRNIHYQQQESEADRQHAVRMQDVEQTKQRLLEAKVRVETYSRLRVRREQLARHSELQKQQRISDESGATRATFASPFLSLRAGENQYDD